MPSKLALATGLGLLLLLGFPSAANPQAQADDPPSFTVTFPRYTYKPPISSVREVDFKNFMLHVFDEHGRSEISARLKDGEFERRTDVSLDQVGLRSIHYFDFKDGKTQRALLIFYWTSVGASWSGYGVVQAFEVAFGRLTVSQQIFYIWKVGAGASFDPATETLTVRATHYTKSDAHCCPSKLDIVTFRWTGQEFKQHALKTILVDSPKHNQ